MTNKPERGAIMKGSVAFCLAFILLSANPAAAESTFPWPSTGGSARDSSEQKKPESTESTTAGRPASGNRIYKENGKTCSGLGKYKVCW